jgi:hypothetical protein
MLTVIYAVWSRNFSKLFLIFTDYVYDFHTYVNNKKESTDLDTE